MQAVRTLAERNSQFMRTEVELCRLDNMGSVTRLELDQKEKALAELAERDDKEPAAL